MTLQPTKVLLVEDLTADAIYIRELLSESESKWTVTHVQRLSLALHLLSQEAFDVALLDLSLPDSSELNIVVQIHSRFPDLALIVLTGLDDESVGVAALRQGAQDYLVKGQLDRNLLIKSIRYAIERAASQRIMRQQAAAMAASSEGIALLNQSYLYFYANRAYATLFGYDSLEQLLGRPWTLLQNTTKVQPSILTIQQALECGEWRGDVSGVGPCGFVFDVALSITRFDQGSYICLVRDIQERKQAQLEIQRALEKERELNQLKSSFMATVSHEFRTPMTGIRMAASLLEKNRNLSDEKRSDYFQRIQSSINEMIQLLDELLLLDRVNKGGLRYQPVQFNLRGFCLELAETIQFNAGSSHNIQFACDGLKTPAEMDKVLLRHILTNLLSNAIKYSPQGGRIEFLLQEREQIAIFDIKDQGIGIPEGDLQSLFQPFHRCSNAGQIPGTGLGLSIVQQCVELHRGVIQVSSQVGKGTTFTVSLPLQPVMS
jgi:PAS domain S-box-containing protein